MPTPKENEPAFPELIIIQGKYNPDETMPHIGLTKLELFSAMMAQGILSNADVDLIKNSTDIVSKAAIAQAESLIGELSKREKQE